MDEGGYSIQHHDLTRDHQLLLSTVESAPVGVALLDRDLRFVWVNSAGAETIGHPASDLVGRTVRDALLPAAVAEVEPILQEVLRSGEPVNREVDAPTEALGGAVRTYRISYYPAHAPDGRVLGIGTLFQDVTDELKGREAVRQAEHTAALMQAVMEAAQAERVAISTAIHDDTVQVMTASLLSLDRIEQRAATCDDPEITRLVREARLTLSDATERTRRLMFELRPQELTALGLSPALASLASAAGRAMNAQVTVDVKAGRCPSEVEELVYRSFQEFVANARKHSGASAVTLRVRERDGFLDCCVADDGVGFDIERASGNASPLHIGLQAAAERIKLAGGDITVESSPGRGTQVRFRVPTTGWAAASD